MNQQLRRIMKDAAIRQAFGNRVKELRKQKDWTQKELANRVGVSYQQLNKYEGGTNAPPLDRLVSLASALETTADFLITGNLTESIPLHNTRLIERFQELEAFNNEDQETVVKLIDAMIAKQRMEHAMKPIG